MVSYVLVAFAAISLVVSTIMIARLKRIRWKRLGRNKRVVMRVVWLAEIILFISYGIAFFHSHTALQTRYL